MVKIKILPPLSRAIGQKEVELQPAIATVRGALEALCEKYPQARPIIFDEKGELSFDYKCMHNFKDISFEKGLDTEVTAGDEIMLLLPIAGGGGIAAKVAQPHGEIALEG